MVTGHSGPWCVAAGYRAIWEIVDPACRVQADLYLEVVTEATLHADSGQIQATGGGGDSGQYRDTEQMEAGRNIEFWQNMGEGKLHREQGETNDLIQTDKLKSRSLRGIFKNLRNIGDRI